jgi:Ca2+-binding RTX toxin-like protein
VTGTNSDGGGVRFNDSVVTIVNSTITGNSAPCAGGGIGFRVDATDKKLMIHYSIMAGNTAASNPDFTAPDTPATKLEVRHSLIGRSDGTTLTASGISLNLGTTGTQVVHPTNLSLILGSATTFENVTGGSGADTLTGNSLGNTLLGGTGNDKQNGLGGSDILSGGLNDDSFFFKTATPTEADQVSELANQRTDTLSFAIISAPIELNPGTLSIQDVHTGRTLNRNALNVVKNIVGGLGGRIWNRLLSKGAR